jgi:DNA polymerase-1
LRDEHPVVPLILEHREVQKLLTTYVDALLVHSEKDGRVHAQFLQHGSATGRFSSANPNLQNIPIKGELGREIRHGFMASKGHVLVASDYSQIELRVLAILSNDAELIATFARGEDIHTSVASRMFDVPLTNVTTEMRRVAKVINFGILFGMGVSALAKNLGSDRAEAQRFYNNYFETFPAVAKYLEDTKEVARSKGYTETLFGRRRYFPQINAGAPFLRAFAERMATNAPIQGTEADILKIAMLLINDDLKAAGLLSKAHLLLQIHDELVYEVEVGVVDRVQEIIRSAMEHAFKRSPITIPTPPVPLAVSLGTGDRLDEVK